MRVVVIGRPNQKVMQRTRGFAISLADLGYTKNHVRELVVRDKVGKVRKNQAMRGSWKFWVSYSIKGNNEGEKTGSVIRASALKPQGLGFYSSSRECISVAGSPAQA